ncbi:unnamed protein product [Effrenium voratum]|uniref:Uncharacterized protein n=1 Tax=Effrenium voratum TaxID=2562239 RepID=A0AA36MXF9_9DINO|nr:unnamed protein product [Effrenium voratum]
MHVSSQCFHNYASPLPSGANAAYPTGGGSAAAYAMQALPGQAPFGPAAAPGRQQLLSAEAIAMHQQMEHQLGFGADLQAPWNGLQASHQPYMGQTAPSTGMIGFAPFTQPLPSQGPFTFHGPGRGQQPMTQASALSSGSLDVTSSSVPQMPTTLPTSVSSAAPGERSQKRSKLCKQAFDFVDALRTGHIDCSRELGHALANGAMTLAGVFKWQALFWLRSCMSNKTKMTSFAVLLALASVAHAAGAPDWCKWVPSASLQYVGECSGAAPAPQQGFGYGDGPDGCVNWCVWVPGKDWHQTNECKRCAEYYPVEPMGAHAGCEGWCQWVSQPSWQYMDNCRGCRAKQASMKAAVPDSSGSAKLAGEKMATGAPDWCKWVPSASLQYVGECSGAAPAPQQGFGYGDGPDGCVNWCVWVPGKDWHQTNECKRCAEYYPVEPMGAHAGCEGWCQWVSQPSWQYMDNCRGCRANQASVKAAVPDSSGSAKLAGEKMATGAPDWCKWVPSASLQYVGECSGAAPAPQQGFGYGDGPDGCVNWCVWVPGKDWHQTNECKRCAEYYPVEPMGAHAGCEGWCQWVSQPSWQYMDNCRGCRANQASVKAAVPDSSGSAKLAGEKMATGAPDWCKWVPSASLQYVGECSGAAPAPQQGFGYGDGPDGCVNWCVWVPGKDWHQTNECKRCAEYYPVEPMGAHAGCEGWCQWVSQPSWQYMDNCRGCGAHKASEKAAEPSGDQAKAADDSRPILP